MGVFGVENGVADRVQSGTGSELLVLGVEFACRIREG
jgi:hypothetical protein